MDVIICIQGYLNKQLFLLIANIIYLKKRQAMMPSSIQATSAMPGNQSSQQNNQVNISQFIQFFRILRMYYLLLSDNFNFPL